MGATKKQKPVQITELARPVHELTSEQAEATEGGIIAILIGLRTETVDKNETLLGAAKLGRG